MPKYHCPNCGAEMPDNDSICPRCGYDIEKTVKVDAPNDRLSTELFITPQPKPKRNRTKQWLIIAAVVFLLIDVALGAYYFKRKHDREEAERVAQVELQRQMRADSLAHVARVREKAIADSTAQAQRTKEQFAKFGTFAVAQSAYGYSYETDEYIKDAATAFNMQRDQSQALRKLGYLQLYSRSIPDSNYSDDGIPANIEEEVYGINCEWDPDAQQPRDKVEPWSCVVVTHGGCYDRVRIFFDNSDSRERFFSTMPKQGLRRLADGNFSGTLGYLDSETGRFIIDDGPCGGNFSVARDINNTVVIQ